MRPVGQYRSVRFHVAELNPGLFQGVERAHRLKTPWRREAGKGGGRSNDVRNLGGREEAGRMPDARFVVFWQGFVA